MRKDGKTLCSEANGFYKEVHYECCALGCCSHQQRDLGLEAFDDWIGRLYNEAPTTTTTTRTTTIKPKNNWFYEQNNCYASASHFLVHRCFSWRPLDDYDVKPPNATFCGGRGFTTTNCPFSIWTWIKSLRIQLQENSPTFYELCSF